jgi:long-chain acyl-CoA synthetase
MMKSTPLHFFLKWEKDTPDNTFLRQPIDGRWHVYTYRQAGDEVRRIAAALKKLDLPPQSKIAILSKNCAHWIMTDLAIMFSGHISVPLYPTLSAGAIRQILEHSEAKVIFLGKLDDYASQQSGIPSTLQKISFPFYGLQDGLLWSDLLREHQPLNGEIDVDPDQLATIMYSSGTTGTAKGAMLSFGALGFTGEHVKNNLSLASPQRFFSYLPLSHIAERGMIEMVVFASGSSISFAESLDTFSENLQHEKPTLFGGVPRIWAKFQDGILAKLPQRKLDTLLSIPLVSTIIKRSIRKKLGLSKAHIIVSGAAPIPVSLLEWFKRLDIPIREMYGMTENTAFSHSCYKEIKIGSVGQAWPQAEVKLSDDGEILVRHGALMKGYFKDPETTAAVFTPDGFLKTGDRGVIDNEGFLTITGRIKDQFKTDKAKFVAPAPIEMKLLTNKDIEQVCVVGMGIPQPIALVVLSAAGKAKSKGSILESISHSLQEINPSLESYERLEKAVIMKEEWTVANGLLTPSLKLKRNELEKIHLPKYPMWYRQGPLVVWE